MTDLHKRALKALGYKQDCNGEFYSPLASGRVFPRSNNELIGMLLVDLDTRLSHDWTLSSTLHDCLYTISSYLGSWSETSLLDVLTAAVEAAKEKL